MHLGIRVSVGLVVRTLPVLFVYYVATGTALVFSSQELPLTSKEQSIGVV